MGTSMTKDEVIANRDVQGLIRTLREEFDDFEDNIPSSLKKIKGWFVWKVTEINADTGKFNKIPVYPRSRKQRHGEQGSEEDLQNLGTWIDARMAFNSDRSSAGVGFATLPSFNMVALDVDHCIKDGKVQEDVLQLTKNTYCEISPSGTGIRAFWQGTSGNSKNHDQGYELFHSKGFVTVTGNVVKNEYHRRNDSNKPLPLLDGKTRDKLEELCRAPGKKEVLSPAISMIKAAREIYEVIPPQTIADLRSALLFMRADDRELWQRMGHCLKTLGDVGRGLFMEWSATSDKHDPDKDAKTWESFKPTRTSWRGVFSEAQKMEWKNPMSKVEQSEDREMISNIDNVIKLEQNIIKLDVLDALENPFDILPHYVDKWIPQNEVTLLAGHGGSGKSYVALSIAIHVAMGKPFADLPTTQANVMFFSGEDGELVLRNRFLKLCRALKIDPEELENKLHLLDASDIDPALHREQRVFDKGRQKIVTETLLLDTLTELVDKLDIGLLIIDNASDTYDDEIKRARVRRFVRSLRSRIARPDRAVLLLAHINKASATHGRSVGNEDYSGSTAWHNSVRSRLSLALKDKNKDLLTIEHMKANFGEKSGPVSLDWHAGVPLVTGSYTFAGAEAAAAAEKIRDETDKAALITLIQDCDKRDERVTTSFQGSATVFRLLKGEPGFPKNTDSHRLMRLLRKMETEGSIYRKTVKTPDRKERQVFTCTPNSETQAAEVAAEFTKEACAHL